MSLCRFDQKQERCRAEVPLVVAQDAGDRRPHVVELLHRRGVDVVEALVGLWHESIRLW